MNKVKALLQNTNFITQPQLIISGIIQDDVEEFCTHYNLTWAVSSRIGGIFFMKDGELVGNFKTIFKDE